MKYLQYYVIVKPPMYICGGYFTNGITNDLKKGPWTLRNTIDYVVFPIGLALDPDNASVWLSYGRKVLLNIITIGQFSL